ncbi:uncharacterized protein LOC131947188 isoform X2 [Physella acuta]|uniref:uncharacterized protein LOC131947188 isoform X2 n=1 Tax=Physella acuta TaxID=109671 RepID=UPI0027DC8389|nr:uncharacterized protein LOC131947188 isoform X2 [Physella acuta]
MYTMEQEKASQEGKKRRSFLPSFKKSSGISPPSPQAPPSSSTPALLSNLSSVTSLTSSPIVQLPPVTGRAAPYSDREQHRSVTAPYSDREQHRTVTAPYSDREQHRPVTAPYSDREQHRPVTAPYSDREQHRPVTAPYSDREQHRPVTAPYSDREQHRPVTAPYSDREQHRPVTAPYSDREQHRPVTAPYSDREQHRPVTAPYSDREQHRPVQLPKKEKEENLSFGVGLRVGARVKIGGIKPGILRYLGTTHLAPGIFCGIELFDPDGNHDGEVNGHRYFTCAPNYGIFAPKEKVCLETASALGRLASDSEGCYSSSESLHERTSKAFKCYEEGELEAIDCTKLSPIISPQEVDDDVVTRQHRASKLPSKSKLASVYRGADLSPEPLEPPDLEDIPQKRAKSGLPRARSSLPAPPVSQSKLPTFSRSYAKYSEPPSLYARTITYSGQPYEQQIQESLKKSQNAPVLTDSDVDSERYKTGSARSSEDSEEDGFVRDTLSRGIKKQLRADSRQYLNFTFDPEEITQSQDADDSDDSDVETYRAANPPSTVNPLYVDPHFIRDISGESSDDGVHCQRASSQSVTLAEHSSYLPSEELPTVTSAVYSSRVPGAIRSDSYTIGVANERRVISMSFSGSESDDDATRLSATRSISESDLPPEMLPRVDDGSLGGFPADSDTGDDDRISEGGYRIANNGDGCSGGLHLTRPLDSRKAESCIVTQAQSGVGLSQSQSYTVCSQETDNKRDHSKVDRSATASQSYSISKSNSTTSSPSKKYRKISTGSSANDGGDSSSSGTEPKTDSSGEVKGENLDDSSTGASPEVSQALEWDYGQEFDGKIPLSQQDNTMTTSASTGTSESLSDVLRDISEHSDGPIEPEGASSVIDDSDLFEAPDNEFENIDSLEDFPIFGKDAKTIMTDSGISDKSFEFCPNKSSSSTVCGNSSDECSREDDASSHTTTRAISSDSSQETLAAECAADTPGSIEDKDFLSEDICPTSQVASYDDLSRMDSFGDDNSNSPASVVSMEDVSGMHDKTLMSDDVSVDMDSDNRDGSREDLLMMADTGLDTEMTALSPGGRMGGADGRSLGRRERPISLISSTSADTGYVPDTDSELGTLTTNSPNTDWVDRRGVTHPTSHAPTERGLQQMDIDMDDKLSTPSLTETTPTCSGHSLGTAKNTEDEDYNSDLQTNTEDDRIEADQLYGHDGTGSLTPELPPPTDMDDHAHSSGADDTHDVCGDSAAGSSPAPNRGSSPREEDDGKSSKKDDAAQQRTGRQKKPITITKKRSENVDHKMPNINVTSKLADYIKAPTPVKPREEREPKKVFNKNAKNLMQKRGNENKTKAEISRASSVDSVDREKVDKPEKPEKPKPIIKREKPKSKWDNIMSQIEQSKDTTKPKPKSDIKSSLAAYLSTPPPQLPTDNNAVVGVVKNDQQPPKKREFVKRIKPLPPPPPKIDLSKIKSKLNVPTAASAVKAMPKRDVSPGHGKVKNRVSRDNSPGGSSAMLQDGLKKRMSDGHIVLLRQELSTTVSSVRTSRTDLSGCVSMESVADSKGNTSKRGSVDVAMKVDRRFSTNSIKSDFSDRTKPDHAQLNQEGRSRRSQVKSTIPPHTPVKLPSRAMEIRLGDASSISSQRSSPTPVIIKPIKPKPKSNANAKNSPSKPAWGATKPAPPPVSALNKGRDSSANRKNKLNGAIKSTPAASAPKASTTAASAAQKEIERLESLCEARTKELTHTRIQLKATSQGFDAMAVLVNYCCAELNAFECPELAKKLETVQRQLADCLAQISELSKEKDTLGQHLSEVIQEKDEAVKKIEEAMCSAQTEREEHAKVTRDMDDTHNAALTAQRDELTSKHEEAMKKFRLFYEKQMEFMKQGHERQISEVKNEGKLEMNGIRISHLEEIQELRNKHDCQMEELHKQHRNKLEDITCRFESIKLNLSEKVESLRGECEDLRHRARNSEEALQRDADVKVQMALAPFLSLPKEIESLKTVVEMRNEEIQKLRTKNMDLEKQLEEVPIGREKILSLQQKVENLEAIINIKTDHEKQLHERCQVLMRKFDRATRANKRLSMDYEQVMWRMSQSSDFGSSESLTQRQLSRSPPRSPDGRRRTLSPNSAGEVVMRKKRNSHSVGDGERKLRSRSATFVVEKTESSDSHSPSSSPQPKLKRWRKKSEAEEGKDGKSRVERMCHSAGAELISHLEGQDEAPGSTDPSDSMTSSVEMAESLARSVSGVSDSGVYDSMTRSDMLNSSVVSTDSEWAASVNLSMTYDSNIDDLDPDLKSGDFSSLNEVTVLHGSRSVTRSKSGMKASNTVLFCPEKSCEDTKTGPARVEEAVGRPENGDEVFDESVSMESSCCSFDNLDLDNGSRLVSEDFPPDDPPPGTPGKVSEVVVPLDKGDKSVLVPLDKGDKSALKSSQAE